MAPKSTIPTPPCRRSHTPDARSAPASPHASIRHAPARRTDNAPVMALRASPTPLAGYTLEYRPENGMIMPPWREERFVELPLGTHKKRSASSFAHHADPHAKHALLTLPNGQYHAKHARICKFPLRTPRIYARLHSLPCGHHLDRHNTRSSASSFDLLFIASDRINYLRLQI